VIAYNWFYLFYFIFFNFLFLPSNDQNLLFACKQNFQKNFKIYIRLIEWIFLDETNLFNIIMIATNLDEITCRNLLNLIIYCFYN
jgi:hypothetical protein